MKYYTSLPYEIHIHNQSKELHICPEICCLIYVISGTVTVIAPEGVRKTFSSGGIYLFDQSQTRTWMVQANIQSYFAEICIDSNYLDSYNHFDHAVFDIDTTAAPYQNFLRLGQLLRKTIEDYFHPETANITSIGGNMEKCISLALDNFLAPCSDRRSENVQTEQRRLNQLKCILHANCKKPLSLSLLSEEMKMSPQYLSIFIKRHLGTTFLNYITPIRLEIARKYLLFTDEPVTHITSLSGFPNSLSLTKAFRNHFMMTPLEYRKKYQEEHAAYSYLFADNATYLKDLDMFNDIPGPLLMNYYQKLVTPLNLSLDEMHLPPDSSDRNHCLPISDTLFIHDCSELTSPELIRQLKDACGKLPIRYVRVIDLHAPGSLFMAGVDSRYSARQAVRILETIADLGLYPMLLCNMNQPGDNERFIPFLEYCIDHFGYDHVRRWKFEFTLPIALQNSNITPEHEMLELIHSMIPLITYVKKRLPDSKAGGFNAYGLFETTYLDCCLREMKKAGITPDFMTCFLTATYHPGGKDEEYPTTYKLSNNIDIISQRLHGFLRTFRRHYGDMAVEVTAEICFNLHADNVLNDSIFNATYLLSNCLKLRTKIDHLILPTLSDSTFYEKPEKPMPFYGIDSLYTAFGVPKPVLYALSCLSGCHGKLLSCGGSHVASLDGTGCLHLLIFNHKFPDAFYFTNPENKVPAKQMASIFPDMPAEKYDITISGAASSGYFIETETLNQSHGSILDFWIQANTPPYFSNEAVKALADNIRPDFKMTYISPKDNVIHLETEVTMFEIKAIKIYPRSRQYHPDF